VPNSRYQKMEIVWGIGLEKMEQIRKNAYNQIIVMSF
jgi:hypothetical protein